MMWLALDIGNSWIKAGLFFGEELTVIAPLATGEFGDDAFRDVLTREIAGHRVDRVGIASVSPRTTAVVINTLSGLELPSPMIVGSTLSLPFSMHYQTPDTLGADRVASATAAYVLHGRSRGRPVVVVDAGTAITFEVISGSGDFYGGAILPGPDLMMQALCAGTDQLPPVNLHVEPEPPGRSTTEAIRAGVLFGFVDAVRGMIERIEEWSGEESTLVVTGGWSELLGRHLDRPHERDPHLVLRGIRILMEMNP